MLVLIIAPIALVIAVAHTLNRLTTDSEIIVMNAAGMSPWRMFRPFLAATLVGLGAGRRHQRLSRAGRPAHAARLADRGARPTSSPTSSSPAASSPIERGLDLPHPRAPPQRPAARHLHRRPARSARSASPSSPNTARSSKNEQGTFLILENGSIQRQETEAARSDHRAVRALRLRPVAVHRRTAGRQVLRCASATSGTSCVPDPDDPDYKAATGAIPRRVARPAARADLSDRVHGDRALRSSARRAPRGKAAAWSIVVVIVARGHAAADRLCLHRVHA